MNYSTKKLKYYFLNNLSNVEMDEIELQIISGKITEENLLIAENELIEDYLEKNLSPSELELFQNNFLASRESQISQISVLKQYANSKSALQIIEDQSDGSNYSFFQRLVLLPSFFPLRAALILVIVGFFVWIFAFIFIKKPSNNNPIALEQEFAKFNQEDLSDVGKFNDMSAISLMTGNFRGGNATNKLSKQNLTGKVLVRLALPNGIDLAKDFSVSFLNNGKPVFTQMIRRTYKNPYGSEIRLFIPSEVLEKGDHEINVKSSATENSTLKYIFSVN